MRKAIKKEEHGASEGEVILSKEDVGGADPIAPSAGGW